MPENSEHPVSDDAISRKLDSNMRRLLEMSDEDIREKAEADSSRLKRETEKLEEGIRRLQPNATAADREAVARILRMRRSELLPKRLLSAAILEKVGPVRIKAVVRYTGNRADLEAQGLTVRAQAQDVFTVAGTTKQLKDLAAQPACRRLRTPRMMFPTVEEAGAQAEIANVHDPRPPANPSGYRGSGVLLGIVDSPLDVTHHGFRDPDVTGNHDSRVLYYWVQTPQPVANPPGLTPEQFTNAAAAGTRPNFAGLNYGRLYTNADINTALAQANPYGAGNNQICCTPGTATEHGTHCAGTAAGSGHVANWNTNPVHVGAAPEASIIHVRLETLQGALDTGATFEDSLLDGIDFCFRAAQFENMPCVVSVSQGSNFGPHNGWTDFDLARDNLLNSFDNRSVVFSSGNDNGNQGHRKGAVAAGNGIDNFTLTARRNMPMWLDVWYSGPELDYRISFGGNNSGWRTAGLDYAGVISGQDIEAERDIEPGGGLRGIRIYMEDAAFGDVYTFELRNPHASQAVNYLAWSGLQGWWADLSGSTQHDMTLGDTGCGRSILTVGASKKVRPPNPATGEEVTRYSGAGPTADGRIKPEIIAVGGTSDDPATAAVNEYDPIWSTASDQNSGYTDMIGTSMSTPLAAGAVALILEEYNSAPPAGLGRPINQDSIKALLIQYANRLNLDIDPSQPGYDAEERNRYGYGRLRMIGPIDHLRPPVDIDLWVRTADDDYGEEPYPGGCFCGAPDIRVFQHGTNNETTQITWGTTYDVRVRVRNLGDTDAAGVTVRLKYTLPHAAPSDWFEAEDASNNKLSQSVNVQAMDDTEVVFQWRPEASELSAPAGTTHFCLLAEVNHPSDPLVFPAPTTSGGSAWSTNIKSTNNVALRNLHIA